MSGRFSLKSLLRNGFYALLTLAAIPILVVLVFAMFWRVPSCGEDSEAVAYARSLSADRLEQLYRDMEQYSQRDDMPIGGYEVGDRRYEIPGAFSDLKVQKIRPREANIMVKGCFDHYIYLRFEGIGRFAGLGDEKRIILNWGEHPPNAGTEVLWSDP